MLDNNATPGDGASVDVSQDTHPEQATSGGGSWFDRMLGRAPRPASDTQDAAASGETPAEQTGGAQTHRGQGQAPQTLDLAPEELERRVQAETDRRESKRRQDEVRRAQGAERERLVKLREEDPVAYVEEMGAIDEREHAAQTHAQVIQNVATYYDEQVIDPLIKALPADVARAILQGGPAEGDNRPHIVQEAFKAIQKAAYERGKKDGEAAVRKNPAVLKQIRAELRDQEETPDFVPASGGNGVGKDMNNFIRSALSKR